MANARGRRFTIYDMMEDKGVFDANPANIGARDSTGLNIHVKAEYPKMLYHPEGKEVVTVRATPIATPFGPQMVGEQRELVSIVVKSKEEEDLKLAEGWHKLPIMAIRERFKLAGQEPPAILSNPYDVQRVEQEDEIAKLKRELAEMSIRQAETEAALADATKHKSSGK